MRRLGALLLLAGLTLAGASPASTSGPKRSTVDRPDEVAGRQIHAVYVVPKDGRDRRLDVDATLESVLWSSQDWLAGAAEGLSLRMDTFQGRIDISYLRSSRTSADLRAEHLGIPNALVGDLRAAGFTRNPRKVALVLYDGPMSKSDGGLLCGVARGRIALPRIALVNVRARACGQLRRTGPFSRRDKTIPHEVFHATGQLPDSAPRSDGDGHSTDPTDLMYGRGVTMQETEALRVDPGHDDYWNDVLPWLTRSHLALRVAVEGRGSVSPYTRARGSLNPCGRRCAFWFRRGGRVLVLPIPSDRFSRFDRWGGACTGRRQCVVSIKGNRLVTAAFEEIAVLDVRTRGPGVVRVAGHSTCRSYCRYQLEPGRRASLVAAPARGARFVGWAGGCTMKARCEVVVRPRRDHTLTAVFARKR